MKLSLSRLESLFRNVFGVLCPVLLSLGIFFAAVFFWEYEQDQARQSRQQLWGEKAEILLASVRSNLTFSDLFSKSGNDFANFMERHGSSAFSAELLEKALQKYFPENFMDSNCHLWAFSLKGGKPSAISGRRFERSKLRLMERMMSGMLELANNSDITTAQISSHEKFIRGILGHHSSPLHLGKNREGRLTPVVHDSRSFYLYWRQFKENGSPFAGFMTLIPSEKIENSEFALQLIATRTLEDSRRHMGVAFVPAKGMEQSLKPILPEQFKSDPEYGRTILHLLNQVSSASKNSTEKSAGNKTNRSQQIGNHLFLRDFTSTDLPYDAVIFAPVPQSLQVSRIHRLPLAAIVLAAWIAIFFLMYLRNGRLGLPLGFSFRLLFFFSGLLPIFFMLSLGYSLVEESHSSAVEELKSDASGRLNSINESSDSLLPLYGSNISQMIKGLNLHPLLISPRREDVQLAFDKGRRHLKGMELSLDCMFVFQPGGLSELIVHDQRQKRTYKTNMNIFAPAIYKVNYSFRHFGNLLPIRLDASQKNFLEIFGGFHSNFLEEMFLLSYEKESFVKFGDNSRDYYFSTILSENGVIRSYVVFVASSEELFRSFLARQLDSLNVSDSSVFLAAEELANSEFTIFPFKKLNVLNSRIGRNALVFLRKCRSSIFEKYITDRENLYVFFPLSKMNRYAAGCIISLSGVNTQRDFKRLALVSIAILLACIMYVMASIASAHLLEPLNRINHALNRISSGDLDSRILSSRTDELGQLEKAINLMIDGLKKRLRLGKFVSAAFEQSLATTIDLEKFKKARYLQGTVLFSDIRSFTSLAETFTPGEIASMLNLHLETMTEEIQKRGGQVEQFIGDAIVAVFPDKEKSDSHCQAIQAALAMYNAHKTISLKREHLRQFAYSFGIGLEHGQLIAGPLITPDRSEFLLIGKAKEQAEQYEQLSKQGKNTRIIFSKNLINALKLEPGVQYEQLEKTELFEMVIPGEKA